MRSAERAVLQIGVKYGKKSIGHYQTAGLELQLRICLDNQSQKQIFQSFKKLIKKSAFVKISFARGTIAFIDPGSHSTIFIHSRL